MSWLKDVRSIIQDLVTDKKMLWRLSKNDFKARFASSMLGIVWAYVQPLATILVFWFVFQVGLRSPDVGSLPFIVWYTPAFLVWTFFQDTLSSMTNSIRDYSYLVRKVNFHTCLIPFVKLISGCFVHVVFIVFIFVINIIYGVPLSVYNFQVLYYFLCTIVLLIGLGILCATITPFVGDVPNIVSVVLQIMFWATPIVWNENILSPGVASVMRWNPMYYICTGYRASFQNQMLFWKRPETIWFWVGVLCLVVFSMHLFQKLNRDFVDVL